MYYVSRSTERESGIPGVARRMHARLIVNDSVVGGAMPRNWSRQRERDQDETIYREHVRTTAAVAAQIAAESAGTVAEMAEALTTCLRAGGKVLLCGNGGSAAEAQHLAAELVGRYLRERRPLPAIALTTDTSVLTAIANDYRFEDVFRRQIDALAVAGDVLIALSTSGTSADVVMAAQAARAKGVIVLAFTG